MYRAITYASIIDMIPFNEIEINEIWLNSQKIEFKKNQNTLRYHTFLNGIDIENQIRSMEVNALVSPISTLAIVRKYLVEKQQEIGKNKGVVMDGRDIGTVVFPEAELKFFMTAQPEIRAQRRYEEYREKGNFDITFDEVLSNLNTRDKIDSSRQHSPLKKADDAIVIDNSFLDKNQQFEIAINYYNLKMEEINIK